MADGDADDRPTLVLFPGLGIDGTIYRRQRGLPVRLLTPSWIDPEPGDTVETYARRMAAAVAPEVAAATGVGGRGGSRLFLGGLSFGGIVALEAARVLPAEGVFLIGSAWSWRAVAPEIGAFLNAAGALPPEALRRGLAFAPLFVRIVGRPDRRAREVLVSTIPRVNARQAAWGARAMMRWEFRGNPPCPVYQIHGELDRIVPVRRVRPDVVVPGAGHALNVTHAHAVNRFILERMGVGRRSGSADLRREYGGGGYGAAPLTAGEHVNGGGAAPLR